MKKLSDWSPKQIVLTLIAALAAILGLWGGLISVGLLDPVSNDTPQASPEQRQAVLGRWCSTDENAFNKNASLNFAGQGLDVRLTSNLRVFADIVDTPVKLFTGNSSIVFTTDQQPGTVFVIDPRNHTLMMEIYRKAPASDFGTGEFLHRQFYERCA